MAVTGGDGSGRTRGKEERMGRSVNEVETACSVVAATLSIFIVAPENRKEGEEKRRRGGRDKLTTEKGVDDLRSTGNVRCPRKHRLYSAVPRADDRQSDQEAQDRRGTMHEAPCFF